MSSGITPASLTTLYELLSGQIVHRNFGLRHSAPLTTVAVPTLSELEASVREEILWRNPLENGFWGFVIIIFAFIVFISAPELHIERTGLEFLLEFNLGRLPWSSYEIWWALGPWIVCWWAAISWFLLFLFSCVWQWLSGWKGNFWS